MGWNVCTSLRGVNSRTGISEVVGIFILWSVIHLKLQPEKGIVCACRCWWKGEKVKYGKSSSLKHLVWSNFKSLTQEGNEKLYRSTGTS